MFKMKKVIASLACAVMVFMSMSTLCLAVEELDIQLNRRVTFVGDTYYDWNGKKVRKDNGDDEETSGMIISINNRKSKGIYISGKGYIGRDQIKAVEGKILEVEFDKDTLTSSLKFDGDYVNIESTNDGVLEYEDGVLKVGLETGKTTITIENKDGKLVEMEAEVTDTTVTINIPEKSAELAVEEATLVVKVPDEETGEDKEIIEVTGKGNATAKVELENGTVKVDATAKADGTVEVKGEEIIKAAIDANATITGTMDEKGLTVTGKGDVNADASIIVDGEEVVKAEIDATGTVTGTVNEEGLTVTGKGEADTTVTVKDKEVVKANHPNGDCGLVKTFTAAENGDEQIQQGGRNRQNDLTPRIGSFRTDKDKAGHYRANHAKYHHPGEEVLHTDIKVRFSFHNNVIITNYS